MWVPPLLSSTVFYLVNLDVLEAIKPKAHLANLQLSQAQSDSAVGEWLRLAKNRLTEKRTVKQENNRANKVPEVQNGNLQKSVPSTASQVSYNVTTNHLHIANQHSNERVMTVPIPIHENHFMQAAHTPTQHNMPMMINPKREFMPLPPHEMIPRNMDVHLKPVAWMNTHYNIIKQQE
ncbi:hypothetical protein RN001_002345 [Aquatica leii]|uniref:Uncharacterized protein n=1 Tax=Aquatica leii TaxID=1421715 RepID=A0AAN7PGV2_9COLE|nr:hypothetical protein RN001_002345 [Aquatica leii]